MEPSHLPCSSLTHPAAILTPSIGVLRWIRGKEIKGYVADFREFLQEGTFPERKALIRNFVQGIEIVEDQAVLTYTIPMPSDGVTSDSAPVLDFVQSGPPTHTVDTTIFEMWIGSLSTHRGLAIPVG